MQGQVQYLQHHQINKKQWDDCIRQSLHGLIYATSLYLDNVCPGWEAIIDSNYSWVMPVTANQKFLVKYLFQPALTQQLGVFEKDNTVEIPWKQVIEVLKNKFRFWEISLNHATPVSFFSNEMEVKPGVNYVLSLQESYATIRDHFHKDLKKNLKRCEQFRLVCKTAEYPECITEYKLHYAERIKHVTQRDYDRFNNICDQLSRENKVVCRKVVNQQNELMATILLLFDGRRLYNMMNTTTDAGRKVEANHFLIDSVIREFAGQDLIFDFEGSDLPGVKTFYENFGSLNQPYFRVKYNNLAWPAKLFK